MANDLNQCNFIGRLGKDVETRYMPNGEAVSSFSIAVGSSWKDKAGDKKEETEWVNITAFRKLGEICGQYLKKGSKVFISGRMKTDKYTDKEGIERYSTKVIAENMQMLDGKPGANSGTDDDYGSSAPAPRQAAKPAASNFNDMDDDIPF